MIPASAQPKAHALDHAATGISYQMTIITKFYVNRKDRLEGNKGKYAAGADI
jgi:hypothetical protein